MTIPRALATALRWVWRAHPSVPGYCWYVFQVDPEARCLTPAQLQRMRRHGSRP